MNENAQTTSLDKPRLDHIVGSAVKNHRGLAGLTLMELSDISGVSTAMISKIERGQVSASLSTLQSLADAIGVSLINFFAGTAIHSDVSFVPAGEGITVQRMGGGFDHIYKVIGRAAGRHVSFDAYTVTLESALPEGTMYSHPGVEYIQVTDGEMMFLCGKTRYHMRPGDSLSYESTTAHGPVELLTEKVTFLNFVARAIPNND